MDFYLEKYIDLKSLKIKELLWNHYIHDGLNESRELFKDEKINFTLFCLLHNIDLVIDGSDSDDEQDNNYCMRIDDQGGAVGEQKTLTRGKSDMQVDTHGREIGLNIDKVEKISMKNPYDNSSRSQVNPV